MAYSTIFLDRGKFDGNEKLYEVIEEAGGPLETLSKCPITTLLSYADSDNSKVKSIRGLLDVLEDLEVGSKLGFSYFNKDERGPDCASEAIITENTKLLEVKKTYTTSKSLTATFSNIVDLEKAECFTDPRLSVAAGIFDGDSLKCIIYGPGINIADKLIQHYNRREAKEISSNSINVKIGVKALLEKHNFRIKLVDATKEEIADIFKKFWKTFKVAPYIID